MTSPLENLAGPGGPLASEPADGAEITGLIRSGRLRLADARFARQPFRSRLQRRVCVEPCRLALSGISRPHRYIVFQALPHTLGLGADVWRVLAKVHDLRNLAEYDGHVDVDERLVRDLISACEAVASAFA